MSVVEHCEEAVNYDKFGTSLEEKQNCKDICKHIFNEALRYAGEHRKLIWWDKFIGQWEAIKEMKRRQRNTSREVSSDLSDALAEINQPVVVVKQPTLVEEELDLDILEVEPVKPIISSQSVLPVI